MEAISFLKRDVKPHVVYVALLLSVTFYYLIQWPIFAGDTDIWYHLNGGRFIVDHRSLPSDSFFSFISPVREWIDYYWLFQATVYVIHLFSGYYGLIALRTLVFLAIISLILLVLYRRTEGSEKSLLYLTIVFSLYLMCLLPRYQLVRPHIFSYLFVVVFLYILESQKRKAAPLLFPLAVVWCNVHGVEYPVMLLILIAYLCEFAVTHLRNGKGIEKDEFLYIIPIVLSMAAVFLTPHFSRLTWVPLVSTKSASYYIQELRHLTFEDLTSFHLYKMFMPLQTASNVLLILASIATLLSLARKKARVSHLLLFAGGIILLTRGNRFSYECALLAMPIIKANRLNLPVKNVHGYAAKLVCIIFIACLAFIPFVSLKNMFSNPPKYPMSFKNLPHGIALFLTHINAEGRVLNTPNNGGYLQWAIYPNYKIFMDMEVPFLFTDEDFYIANRAFQNDVLLKKVLVRYDPSFIAVPVSQSKFREMIRKASQDYVVVFFDDAEVLYVNSRHYPSIAKQYVLKAIDPFTLTNQSVESMTKADGGVAALEELFRIVQIYPGCGFANQAIAMIYNGQGLFEKALPYEDALTQNYPELAIGYRLKADSLKGLNLFDNTIENYVTALRKTDAKNKEDVVHISKELALIYFKQKRYGKAYETFERNINVFSSDISYRDLYYFSLFALMAGKKKEAEALYEYGQLSVAADEKEWHDKYDNLRLMIANTGQN
jgi:tetratricopeptide (TPR) repeat protein